MQLDYETYFEKEKRKTAYPYSLIYAVFRFKRFSRRSTSYRSGMGEKGVWDEQTDNRQHSR